MGVAQIVDRDHGRHILAQLALAAGLGGTERAPEPLRVQVGSPSRSLNTSAPSRASDRASSPRSRFPARSTATVPGSMSITRWDLPVLVAPSRYSAPPPALQTSPAERRMAIVPAFRSRSRQSSAGSSPRRILV